MAAPSVEAAPYVPQTDTSGLVDQLERLSREIELLRQEQAELRQSMNALPPPPEPPSIPTTLIFRDGRRLSIHNYAIVGETLWVLDEQTSTRIAISDLDLNATQAENRRQGVRFPLPAR
jgi:hypothetical protein